MGWSNVVHHWHFSYDGRQIHRQERDPIHAQQFMLCDWKITHQDVQCYHGLRHEQVKLDLVRITDPENRIMEARNIESDGTGTWQTVLTFNNQGNHFQKFLLDVEFRRESEEILTFTKCRCAPRANRDVPAADAATAQRRAAPPPHPAEPPQQRAAPPPHPYSTLSKDLAAQFGREETADGLPHRQ